MRIALWNTEWAKPHTPRGTIIRNLILDADPDLICLTEAVPGMLPDGGHWIGPGDEAPYPRKDDGLKALLWSRWPWDDVANVLPDGTTGRFVEGTTGPEGALVRVTGVCIPWHDSHVHTGRKDRERWEDHVTYVRALRHHHGQIPPNKPRIVLGDYNQFLPNSWVPQSVYEELDAYLRGHDLQVITEGHKDPKLIDHVAVSRGVSGRIDRIWPKEWKGTRLSDHVGILIEVNLTSEPT